MKNKNWFEVSKNGLKALQAGKPKHHIVRELVQNAWDENITVCEVNIAHDKNVARISVVDDSPEGFRDLSDSYTLFQETYKRPDPTKRGRFNVGEKQAIALAEEARIITTKGSIIFEKKGRKKTSTIRLAGSEVILWVKMSKKDVEEILETLRYYIAPEKIKFIVNGERLKQRKPTRVIETSLRTEIEQNGIMKQVQRKTEIWVYKKEKEKAMLYEMGIPVCEIDCLFDISVQQRIPLSIDRETIPDNYLKDIYAEVLNATYEEVEKENSSDIWIREATTNKRINPEVVQDVIKKRFGDKSCVANPFDPNSVDEAIASGYNVIHGSELSKEEWENVRNSKALQSSTELFGKDFASSTRIEPTKEMLAIKDLAQKIAKRILNIDISISFVKSNATTSAQFGDKHLTFNTSRLRKTFWEKPVKAETLDLIIHELAHHKGQHTETSYHSCLTKMASELIIIAINEPQFFE